MRQHSFFSIAAVLAAALVVCVGVPAEAFAAVPAAASHAIGSLGDVAVHFAPHVASALAVLRADLAGLRERAEEKVLEIKDGMDAAAIRTIEDAHAEIAKEIRAKVDEIAVEELRDTRIVTIRSIATAAKLPDLGEEHVRLDTSVDDFRGIVLAQQAMIDEQTRINSNVRVDVGPGNAEQRAAAITNALQHRANPAGVELTPDGRNFRGLTLLEIGRDVLEANGVNTRGMTRQELAGQALAQRSGGMHTTSDFPGILANLANTTLRAGYTAAPQTFRPLVRETSASDFKPITRAQFGEAPSLSKVNEHGEFKRGTIGESKEIYKLATYGRIIGITRQVLVNDDLDAFTRIPQAFGVQAAQLESDLVWGQILANPVMGDGKTLFHADHGNLMTPTAIGLTGLSQGRSLFAKQTGLDGKTVLGLTPAFLIVPVALQTIAEQFVAEIQPTKTADVVPGALQRLQVLAEARLDNGINRPDDDIVAGGSEVSWFLAGNAAQGDIVELAYLDGNRGVYTETRVGFDIDGIEIKARLDVAAKAMDWRNVAKNAGG
ncbi:phage major capsid protein [Rhizobium grahamii]|uniref:Peptidase U35 phage prohead HK97 n=1 Tax=Rhizobium grahamii CCGE 502 TaxID=990285 RepID=S3HZJ0_9HYPH|nr:hypothetical protein [Rhizobium grahamii]EPE98436.1 peptidase U35 phage prohead HK97 [Rhizobium grahamii CCGE 502]